jgi:hypothetical protein
MTRFVFDGVTVQFNCDPIRPAAKSIDSRQLRETDSAGNVIVYGKGEVLTSHSLTFPRVSASVLADLRAFVATAILGVRYPFTWVDHAEVSRTVKLTAPRLRHTPVGAHHRLQIDLEVMV